MPENNFCLLPILSMAAFYDYHYGIIPNSMILLALLLGGLLKAAAGPLPQLPVYSISFLSGIVFLLPVFRRSGAGSGDLKLISLLIAWLHPTGAARLLLPGLMIALLLLLQMQFFDTSCFVSGRTAPPGRSCSVSAKRISCGSRPQLPLAVPIFLGALPLFIL